MALNPREVPVTREAVYAWIQEYVDLDPTTAPPIAEFLAGKLNALELPDTLVNTAAHDDLEDTTSLLQMILNDLPSYGYQVS